MKKYPGKTLTGKVASPHPGNNEDLSKQPRASLQAEVGGFTDEIHAGDEVEVRVYEDPVIRLL